MDYPHNTTYPEAGDDYSGDDQMSRNDDELLQRTRRIETRLTQLMIASGVPTTHQRPKFDSKTSTLHIPSRHTSIAECIKGIPSEWDRPVSIYVGGDLVAVLTELGNLVG